MPTLRITIKDGTVYNIGQSIHDKVYFTWDEYEVNLVRHLAVFTDGVEHRHKEDTVQSLEWIP